MDGMDTRDMRVPERGASPRGSDERNLDSLLAYVARGDQGAFEQVYDRLAGPVYGLIRKVLKDPAQSEEVAQEVLLEVWRNASRFDPAKGGGITWVMMIAHRRAIDRVRSASAEAQRDQKSAIAEAAISPDEVAEAVEANLDRERVRRCLHSLTDLQRESITLAYYGGYTYRQVASLLNVALGTIKTRIRDGLIRMRDCLGVGA
jgi:RNA polymerase sigma-70 factor, ECF subfamily